MKSPDQELYDYVFKQAIKLGFDVYDHLPLSSENAAYPFVVLDAVDTVPSLNKTGYGARLTLTLHVWTSGNSHIIASTMANQLLHVGFRPFATSDYRFVPRDHQSQLWIDTSVPDTVLLHGLVTLVFDLQ